MMSFGAPAAAPVPVPAAPMGGAPVDLAAAANAARDALEKAKKAAQFQKQIAEQMALLRGTIQRPRKLILDEFGRELDEEGNVVPMRPQTVSTLKVNINREKETRLKKILGFKQEGEEGKSWHDNSLKSLPKFERQKRKTFRFVEEGSLVKQE